MSAKPFVTNKASRVSMPLGRRAMTVTESYFSREGFTIQDIPTRKAITLMGNLWEEITGGLKLLGEGDTSLPTTPEQMAEDRKRLQDKIWDLIAMYKEIEYNRGGEDGISPYEYDNYLKEGFRSPSRAKYISIRDKILMLVDKMQLKIG